MSRCASAGMTAAKPGLVPALARRWDEFSGSKLDTSKWNYDLGRGDW